MVPNLVVMSIRKVHVVPQRCFSHQQLIKPKMQQVLCELCAKDVQNIFYYPLDETRFEGYKKIVSKPLSFATISTKVTLFGGKDTPQQFRYNWRDFEDDVVTLLLNSVMYNKYNSEVGSLALRLLGELPSLFVDDDGELCYSRSSLKTLHGGKLETTHHIGAKRSRDSNVNVGTKEIIGDLFAFSGSDQLQQESSMLNFLALWKHEQITSVLVTTLLSSPYTSQKSSTSVTHIPPNHNIPLSVEALEEQVIKHKIPTFSAFLNLVELMLGLAIGATIDAEAVGILADFKTKLASTNPKSIPISHRLVDERLLTIFETFARGYTPTFTSAPGISDNTLSQLRVELKEKVQGGFWLLELLDAPQEAQTAEPLTSLLIVERVLQTLKLINYLSRQDENAIFAFPFLSKVYMEKCASPLNFFMLKMKAIIGLFFAKASSLSSPNNVDITPSAVKTALRVDVDLMVDNSIVFNGPDHVATQLATSLRKQLDELASTKAGIVTY